MIPEGKEKPLAPVTDLVEYRQRHHVERIAKMALDELAKQHAVLAEAVAKNESYEKLRIQMEKVEAATRQAKECICRVTRGLTVLTGEPRR